MHEQIYDLYSRQEFAQQLLDDLESFVTPFSVGLDAKWGDGKTYFVTNFLKPACELKKIPVVVYDCFEHERESDPFVSLTKEILESAETYKSKHCPESVALENKLRIAGNKATSLFVGLAKTAAVAGAKIFLKQGIEELADNFDSADSADSADSEQDFVKFVEEQLKSGQQIKSLKDSFYKSITQLIEEISPDKKYIIVVIDELDRCRPNHAVDVLESIKHLLNIPGVYFLFTYHKAQLKSSLCHIYGSGLDANLYLQKFMDLDIDLPGGGISNKAEKYRRLFGQYLNKTNLKVRSKDRVLSMAQFYGALSDVYKFSPRDIQRCILLHVAYERKDIELFSECTITVIIVLKVLFGDLVSEISKGHFPLNQESLKKYKLTDVLWMFENRQANDTKNKILDEIGFIFFSDSTLKEMINRAPSKSEKDYTANMMKKVLGGTFS